MDIDNTITVSRKEALDRGYATFFTGKPCPNGHISPRRTANWACVGCDGIYRTKHARRHADYVRRWRAEQRAKDPNWRPTKTRKTLKVRQSASQLLQRLMSRARQHARLDKVDLDFDRNYLNRLMRAAIDAGTCSQMLHSPCAASLDKIDTSKPISKDNLQIVPVWYNLAKNRWSMATLHEAMEKFGFTRINQ